jgi:hypothetical protein
MWQPALANADTYFMCLALINNGNRITQAYSGAWVSGATLDNRVVSLPLIKDYCHDSGTGWYAGYYYSAYAHSQSGNILATRAIQVNTPKDTSPNHADYVQSYNMAQVADKLGCPTANGGILSFPGMNQIIALLPPSPASVRIPTVITRMAGQNTLASNLAIELYSGVWQYLGLLVSFKLFKFFKG